MENRGRWAFANNWTAKFEYDYVGLSNTSLTVTIPGGGPDTFSTNKRNVQMVMPAPAVQPELVLPLPMETEQPVPAKLVRIKLLLPTQAPPPFHINEQSVRGETCATSVVNHLPLLLPCTTEPAAAPPAIGVPAPAFVIQYA